MIRVAPPITVKHISRMTQCLIVVKLILIFFHRMPEENSNQDPRPNIKSIEPDIYFTRGFSHISKVRPIEISISCPDDTI
jgi:hypothetical protein